MKRERHPFNTFAIVMVIISFLLAISTHTAIQHAVKSSRYMREAIRAERAGDVENALGQWHMAAVYEPASVRALFRQACLKWDGGYRDYAMVHFSKSLEVGAPWQKRNDTSCFVYNPERAGLSYTHTDIGRIVYPVPAAGDSDRHLLESIAQSPTTNNAERYAALACLNDSADFKLYASVLLELSYRLGRNYSQHVQDCIESMKTSYDVIVQNGELLVTPKDSQSRMWYPGAPLPRGEDE